MSDGGSGRVWAAVIAGAAAVAVALISGYYAQRNDEPPKATATLDFPHNGDRVPLKAGFTASGTVDNLGDYSVWILDFDQGYTVDTVAEIAGKTWKADDQPLGDGNEKLPFNLTMKAVLANPACAEKLTAIMATPDSYTDSLPAGCSVFGEVTVKVDRK